MSKYTTQVRYICEQKAGLSESVDGASIAEVIAAARPVIFDFTFPMYEGETAEALETKILNHYYTREIGLETYGLWKHFLQMRLTEIMPKYVALWKHNVNEIVPAGDIDYYEAFQEENASNSSETENGSSYETGSSSNTNEHTKTGTTQFDKDESTTRTGSETDNTTRTPDIVTKDKYSDTPQGGLSGVETDTYLTTYRNVSESGTEDVDTTRTYNQVKDQIDGDNTETYNITDTDDGSGRTERSGKTSGEKEGQEKGSRESLLHRYGITDYAKFIEMSEKLMNLIINIDIMILDDLKDLFMTIY